MESSDPSFHLIAVSDLAPGLESDSPARPVDKDSLDDFLRGLTPGLQLSVGGGRCDLTFQEFRDFRPERLALRVPALVALLDFRTQVLELASGRGSAEALKPFISRLGGFPELAGALEKALVPAPESVPEPVASPRTPTGNVPPGGLFDLVDVQATKPPESLTAEQVRRTTARLIDAVVGSSASGPAPAVLRAVGAKVDEAVAPLLRAVLSAPPFRELEAAWRGLRLLVRSIDFRSGCRLHVIPAPRARLSRALRDTAMPLVDDLRSEGRTACLLLDFTFDGAEEDLLPIAREASSRDVPVIASGGFEVVVRHLAAGLGDVSQDAWSQLRSDPASRWLVLAANRFLLRAPYGAASDPVRNLDFEELAGADPILSWGRPGWLLAAFVASSAARTGWGTDFAGQGIADAVEPLPLRPGAGETTPLESDLTEAAAQALAEAGLLPLACRRGHDRVFAAGTATAHLARKGEPAASLRQALFAARMSAAVESLRGHLDRTRSIEEIARTVGAALEILGMTPGGPVYSASAAPTPAGGGGVSVRIRPQGGVLRGLPELAFEVPITLM